MPTHLHLVVAIEGRKLGLFVRDFKKYTAQQSLRQYSVDSKLWRERYDRVALWSYEVIDLRLNYCHNNPVKAEFVDLPEKWEWSNASAYLNDRQGVLPV